MKLLLICLLTVSLLFPAHSFAQSTPAGACNQQGTTTTTVLFTDANGVKWNQTRTDTWTLTYVQVSGTSPAVTPLPTPTPTPPVTPPVTPPSAPTTSITGFQTPAGQPLAQVSPGDTLVIVGAGFGTPAVGGNRVQVNGVVAVVKSWTNTAVTIIVPAAVVGSGPAFFQLYAQPANNWVLVASGAGPVIAAAPTNPATPSP